MYVDFSLSFSVALSLKKNRLDLQGAASAGAAAYPLGFQTWFFRMLRRTSQTKRGFGLDTKLTYHDCDYVQLHK